ncbi:alpha/beta hydrolase [Sulfuritalea sp.]|uniref:alpha/beta fold hydrolase n=1 Tax=Sulfuritalea sp. TaxID=2480090 RepID=UPI001AC81372|nr:alpha/beta hydrolase [Sulfuritalea sp.]MBN8475690.1 alpha/beta hydrolase [Sulfuritalea sp.]
MKPGQPWILLRGLTREARHWGDFPRRLGEAFAGAPVISLDLPGNGKLNARPSPASVEDMADFCHAEVARQRIAGPCRVLAMSLGAMVAVSWAQRHPQDLTAAVLINTSLQPFSPFFQRLRPANYARLLRLFALPVSAREVEAEILRMTTRLVADPDVVIAQWLQWRRENPVSRQNALRQLMAAVRYRAPSAPPLERLLLLTSERDALVHASCTLRLARQWGAPVAVHPRAGHDLVLDDAAWVLAHLRRWLEGARS